MTYCKQIPLPLLDTDIDKIKFFYTNGYKIFQQRQQHNPYWKSFDLIKDKKFSFVHFDFDLFKPTVEAINFIKPRLTPYAIILFDDYNFINQEGVKHAIQETKFDIKRSIQTQSGQLICWV